MTEMTSMTAYADRIRQNQTRFDEMVAAISRERDGETAMAIAENAAKFAERSLTHDV